MRGHASDSSQAPFCPGDLTALVSTNTGLEAVDWLGWIARRRCKVRREARKQNIARGLSSDLALPRLAIWACVSLYPPPASPCPYAMIERSSENFPELWLMSHGIKQLGFSEAIDFPEGP